MSNRRLLCLSGELGENGANGGGSNGLNDSKVSDVQIEYRNNAEYGPWGCHYFPLKVFLSIAKVSLKGCTYNT
jgi:hypothetical protein